MGCMASYTTRTTSLRRRSLMRASIFSLPTFVNWPAIEKQLDRFFSVSSSDYAIVVGPRGCGKSRPSVDSVASNHSGVIAVSLGITDRPIDVYEKIAVRSSAIGSRRSSRSRTTSCCGSCFRRRRPSTMRRTRPNRGCRRSSPTSRIALTRRCRC